MKPKDQLENRIGPVNPFALGPVFIEAAKKLDWIHEEQEERQRRFYITAKGFAEMEKLGMDLQRVVHYRPMTPAAENQPSRHERAMAQPGAQTSHQMRPRPHNRQQDDRQHFRQDEQRPAPHRPRHPNQHPNHQQNQHHDRHRHRH